MSPSFISARFSSSFHPSSAKHCGRDGGTRLSSHQLSWHFTPRCRCLELLIPIKLVRVWTELSVTLSTWLFTCFSTSFWRFSLCGGSGGMWLLDGLMVFLSFCKFSFSTTPPLAERSWVYWVDFSSWQF